MNASYRNIAIILVISVVGYFGYQYLNKESSEPDELGQVEATSLVSAEIEATLAVLNSIKLDSGVFQSPTFLSLKDLTVEIAEKPTGRDNPFAPLPK